MSIPKVQTKYGEQDLVYHPRNGIGIVDQIVVADDLLVYYDVIFYRNRRIIGVPEGELRELTWKQFLWYRHPQDGGRMIGKNTWLPLTIATALSLLFVVSGFWVEGWWKLAPIGIGTAIPTVSLWQTWRQYTKKQV